LTSPSARNHGSHFERHKVAFEEGAGKDEVAETYKVAPDLHSGQTSSEKNSEKNGTVV
jgi:hypothetical protein